MLERASTGRGPRARRLGLAGLGLVACQACHSSASEGAVAGASAAATQGPANTPRASASRATVSPRAAASSPASRPATAVPKSPPIPPAVVARRERVARTFAEHLARRAWGSAQALLSEEARGGFDGIKYVWNTTAARPYGAFTRTLRVESTQHGERQRVHVLIELDSGTIDLIPAFVGDSDEVSSVDFGRRRQSYVAPSYVDPRRFTEREVSVGAGATALPGTVAVPRGPRPFAAVLIVGTSKLDDRDGTVGRTWPFRDIAEGLASRGIVALRFEMRAHEAERVEALGGDPRALTIEHEYLNDVAAALATLRAMPEVDPQRLFIAGHAEAGWLTPWLLKGHPDVAGGILLAGHARHLLDLLVPAYESATKRAKGRLTALDRAKIALMVEEGERARDPRLPLDTPEDDLPLGRSAAYWRKLQGYDAVATARALPQPLLLLQGARDLQTTAADDLPLWQRGLGDRADVETKLYDALNHLFIAGNGMATPAEDAKLEGHVAPEVVADIADWVGRTRATSPSRPP